MNRRLQELDVARRLLRKSAGPFANVIRAGKLGIAPSVLAATHAAALGKPMLALD